MTTEGKKHYRKLHQQYRSDKPFEKMTENEKMDYHRWLTNQGLWSGDIIMQNIDRECQKRIRL
jgi:hypothetical protein